MSPPPAAASRPHPVDGEGQVLVVTGSAGGIGRALAEAAAARGYGVVVHSRRRERLDPLVEALRGEGRRFALAVGDLREEEAATSLVETALEAFGRVDVLVNNAAGLFFADAEAISAKGWRAVVDSCLTTAFLCSRAVHGVLKRQGGGAIWNVSSVAAFRPHPGGAHYAAAKAALNNLTETLAVEWGPDGVQVNALALGPVRTESSRFADERHRRAIEKALPCGAVPSAAEVAEIMLGLIALRSPYFTGAVVRLDGGFRGVMADPREQG